MKSNSIIINGSIFLIVILCFVFLGCGGSNRQVQKPSKDPETKVIQTIEKLASPAPGLSKKKTISFSYSQRIQEYRIGLDDILDVSVYGEGDLSKVQRVRPDGHISIPLIGDIKAYGKTPIELRDEISKKLSKYLLRPKVNVLILEYQSKKVIILGEVLAPGLLRLSTNISLLEGISLAGGVTGDSDLRGAMLIRDSELLPVDFHSLLKRGDMRHNITLRHNDKIIIPNNSDNKVFILGEVGSPGILRIVDQLSIAEAITAAGGITPTGQHEIFVIRGGIGDPEILEIDVDKIFEEKDLSHNINLARGDIVYVPKTLITKINTVLGHVGRFLSTIVLFESAVVQYPATKSVLTKGRTPGSTSTTTVTGTGEAISVDIPEKP